VLIDVEISVFQHSCCFDLQFIHAVIMSFIIQIHFFFRRNSKCCICCHVMWLLWCSGYVFFRL